MKRQVILLAAAASLFTFFSCNEPKDSAESDHYILKPDERDLCLQQHIDTALVSLIREKSRARLDLFVPDSIWTWDDKTGDYSVRASTLEGIMLEATSADASSLCDYYRKRCNQKGHTIYVYDQNFGIDNEKDKVAIVNTADKYEILRETGTDGINYDIDNDSVISIVKTLDAKYELTLAGCGLDWCLFYIGKNPDNWNAMAKEVYNVCPDVVDQGTGTVEDLGAELKEYGMLYLWWD
jgi:hypothetical protein